MNWGHGITIAIVLFMGFILYLVFRTTQADFDLVSETYYEDESVFDQRKEALERAVPFGNTIAMEISGDNIVFDLPMQLSESMSSGEIRLIHPAHQRHDRTYAIDKLSPSLPLSDLISKVTYDVEIAMTSGEQEFLFERRIYLP